VYSLSYSFIHSFIHTYQSLNNTAPRARCANCKRPGRLARPVSSLRPAAFAVSRQPRLRPCSAGGLRAASAPWSSPERCLEGTCSTATAKQTSLQTHCVRAAPAVSRVSHVKPRKACGAKQMRAKTIASAGSPHQHRCRPLLPACRQASVLQTCTPAFQGTIPARSAERSGLGEGKGGGLGGRLLGKLSHKHGCWAKLALGLLPANTESKEGTLLTTDTVLSQRETSDIAKGWNVQEINSSVP